MFQYHVTEDNGYISRALRLTITADSVEEAADILRRYGYTVLSTSEEYHCISVAP